MKEPWEDYTPKDYAEWLVNEMRNEIPCHCDDLEQAKQCALIAMKCALDSTRILLSHYVNKNGVKSYMNIYSSKNLSLNYFREVKSEIEKL